MKIKATGMKDKNPVSIVYENGEYSFNGKHNLIFELEIKEHLNIGHAVGGTYYPSKNSQINLINVIENHFFDRGVIAEVYDADIESMESVDGRIY